MKHRKRIVIKAGSTLLASEDTLTARYAFMHALFADIAKLRKDGWDVVFASSGAVALGLNVIKKSPEKASVLDKQAAAACGQPLLINAFKQIALEYGFDIAQVLLTLEDMEGRRRFVNTKNTLNRLFDCGIMPIINENDSITTEEIRVGDNDRLAAKVAQMVQASHLVILTSIDGLYDRNPAEDGAQFVETVEDVSQYLDVTKTTNGLGSGGMFTKMQAANMAQNAGCETIIAKGILERPILSALNNERRHTRCIAKGTPESSFRVWLTDRLAMAGSLVLNAKAINNLKTKQIGIHHSHILSIQGVFNKGDVLHIFDEGGNEIARGLSNYSSDEIMLLAGQTDEKASELLGYKGVPKVISKDNIVRVEEHHLAWPQSDEDVREFPSVLPA